MKKINFTGTDLTVMAQQIADFFKDKMPFNVSSVEVLADNTRPNIVVRYKSIDFTDDEKTILNIVYNESTSSNKIFVNVYNPTIVDGSCVSEGRFLRSYDQDIGKYVASVDFLYEYTPNLIYIFFQKEAACVAYHPNVGYCVGAYIRKGPKLLNFDKKGTPLKMRADSDHISINWTLPNTDSNIMLAPFLDDDLNIIQDVYCNGTGVFGLHDTEQGLYIQPTGYRPGIMFKV